MSGQCPKAQDPGTDRTGPALPKAADPAFAAPAHPFALWHATARRRGVIFAVNIGVPSLIANLAGQPILALLCGIAGLLLSFADGGPTLRERVRLLAWTVLAVGAGGSVGQWLGTASLGFWLVFAGGIFGAGWLNQVGKTHHLVARFGAMALAVGASIPPLPLDQLAYLALPVGVALFSRIVDQIVAGSPNATPVPPAAVPPTGALGWARFALAYAAAGTVALWIGHALSPTRVMWIAATTLVVMLPDARTSYRRIVESMIGAVAGGVLAWLLTESLRSALFVHAAIFLIAFTIPSQMPSRFWLQTGLIAALVMLLYDLSELDQGFDQRLLLERVQDVMLGCALALVGTVLAFPRRATDPPDRDAPGAGR